MAKRSPLAEKLDEVRDRIAAACAKAKREPKEVTLIAVTKTAAPEQIREVLQLGVGDLGESRVQQLIQRGFLHLIITLDRAELDFNSGNVVNAFDN